jgi:hypothetical protein
MIAKFFLLFFLFVQTAFCVDYSQMSTQELLAIIGYVKPVNQPAFVKELESRKQSMTKQQKDTYENNKHKIDKK